MKPAPLPLVLILIAGPAAAVDRYMALTGSDSGGCTSEASPCKSLQYAMSHMNGGDTLFIADGNYTAANNTINQNNHPPAGSPGAFTVIRAKNIPCQDGVPCNQPLKVKFSGSAEFNVDGYPTPRGSFQYIKFWGIRWNGIDVFNECDHLYFKQVASQGVIDGNAEAIGIFGRYNLLEDVVAFGKGRYKILFYDTDRDSQLPGGGHNVCRRCVVRHDWANKNGDGGNRDPIAGIAAYYSRGAACLNCVVIDSDAPSEWMQDTIELSGAFYQPVDSGPSAFRIEGSLAVNVAMGLFFTATGSTGNVLKNVAAVKVAGGVCPIGDVQSDGLTLVSLRPDNFTYRSGQVDLLFAPGMGSENWVNSSSLTNSILRDTQSHGIRGDLRSKDYLNFFKIGGSLYSNASAAAHQYTTDPFLNGLRYPVRVEPGSPLSTQGAGGSAMGARIMNRLGVDGAFKNDRDWDTEQGALWPWPLQDWIQAEMRTSEFGTSPARGFCSTGNGLYGGPVTLTSYVWESLGNPCPPEICGAGSTDLLPPGRPTGLRFR
jgi:hypothetical protein